MRSSLVNLTKFFINSQKLPWTKLLKNNYSIIKVPAFNFCTKHQIPSSQTVQPQKITQTQSIPTQNLKIVHEQAVVGDQNISSYKTKGAISILDNIKGAKNTQSGQLYALMFTCTKCDRKAIRSFTKNAYHKGVVLIRCQGCKNVHLVADNLQWFGEKRNIQTMSEGQVQKVHDPVAITRFIKAAFGDQIPQQEPKKQSAQPKNKNNTDSTAKQQKQSK